MTVSENQDAISVADKSFPPRTWGRAVTELVAEGIALSEFATPLLTLDRGALDHNVATMFAWLSREGLRIAPHGKTTMAPALWDELLDAGAWGLTVATAWQAQVAQTQARWGAGADRILIANEVVDPVALRWLEAELATHPGVVIVCWVDSIAGVERMAAALAGARRPIPVVVELGAPGGRGGARTRAEALATIDAVAASGVLELAGVGGYEASIAEGRTDAVLAAVDAYLDELAALYRDATGRFRSGARPIVTAGGSAYFDRVAARLEHLAGDADVVLRSGAFQIHDDGHYAEVSPMGRVLGDVPFRSAMHAWVRVVSHPEPGLVLLDGGKRDLSFDEGMPMPQRIVGIDRPDSDRALEGGGIVKLNDQHAYLRIDPASAGALPVGTVVRLGLSHPCTSLDRWRRIPVVADADAADPVVVDAVRTWF